MKNIFEQNYSCLKRFQYAFFAIGILYCGTVLLMAGTIFSGIAKGGTNAILTLVILPQFLGYIFPIFLCIGASQAIGWIIGEKNRPTWQLQNGHWIMYLYGVFILFSRAHLLLNTSRDSLLGFSFSLLNACGLALGFFLGGYVLKKVIQYQKQANCIIRQNK